MVQIDRYASPESTGSSPTRSRPCGYVSTTWRHKAARPSPSSARRAPHRLPWRGRQAFERVTRDYDPGAPARVLTSDFSWDWGYESAKLIANRWPEVDAVVCANDLIALGFVQGSIDLGRNIPGELAITGCDDTFFSGVSRPTITSIAQPVWAIASTGIDLLARSTRQRPASLIELAPELHIRASTVPRAAAQSQRRGLLGLPGRLQGAVTKGGRRARPRPRWPPGGEDRCR